MCGHGQGRAKDQYLRPLRNWHNLPTPHPRSGSQAWHGLPLVRELMKTAAASFTRTVIVGHSLLTFRDLLLRPANSSLCCTLSHKLSYIRVSTALLTPAFLSVCLSFLFPHCPQSGQGAQSCWSQYATICSQNLSLFLF